MDSFARLEEKVGVAISMISKLREENGQLEIQRRELEGQVDRLRSENDRLQAHLESTRKDTVDRKEYEARKQEIENRVEGLLDLFSELDQTAEA